jgi:hypothetical protein
MSASGVVHFYLPVPCLLAVVTKRAIADAVIDNFDD